MIQLRLIINIKLAFNVLVKVPFGPIGPSIKLKRWRLAQIVHASKGMVRIFITIHGLRYSWDTHRASNVVAITISSSFLERMVMRGLGHVVDPIWNGPVVVVVGVSILLAWRYYSHACWAIARQVWESFFTWKIIRRN